MEHLDGSFQKQIAWQLTSWWFKNARTLHYRHPHIERGQALIFGQGSQKAVESEFSRETVIELKN